MYIHTYTQQIYHLKLVGLCWFIPPRAPQRRYKIEHAVGAGHFTRAYLATDIESNTKVGIWAEKVGDWSVGHVSSGKFHGF